MDYNSNVVESDKYLEPHYDLLYKIILVGDMGVGKSSIMSQYIKKVFPDSPLPTIAIEFSTKIIKLKEGGSVKAQIWDTAGQEKYKSITSHHYRKAVGALLVYDITRRTTFDNCIKWYTELKNFTEKDCVICLVGNKGDLIKDDENRREVSIKDGKDFSLKNKTLFFETSAKSNHNVSECFEELIQKIYDVRRNSNKSERLTESIVLRKKMLKETNGDINSCC